MLSGMVTLSNNAGQDIAIRPDVLAGIQEASASTGIDFSYLMAQANRESSFNPTAQAKSSSAAGLYQFIEQTWFGVVKAHGAEYGQGNLAEQITRRSDGRFVVADAATRQQILDLRRDPAFAAAMAAEHAADNKAKLEDKLDRTATGADLYMAHFLGISGALKFLRAEAEKPDQTGASLFPKAAAANPAVFYTPEGKARTVGEIYARFEKNINSDMATYAGLELADTDTEVEIALASSAGGDASVPGITTSGYFGGVAGARAGMTTAAPGAVAAPPMQTAALPEVRGFSRVGGLLSPLMLVTLAALPVGRDDEKADQPTGDAPAAESKTGGSGLFNEALFNQALAGNRIDPIRAQFLGAGFPGTGIFGTEPLGMGFTF